MTPTRSIIALAAAIAAAQSYIPSACAQLSRGERETSSVRTQWDLDVQLPSASPIQDASQSASNTDMQDTSKQNRTTATTTKQVLKVANSMIGCKPTLAPTYFGNIANFGILPPTTLDSFVSNAAENAELIYGDEGTDTIPPYFGFTEEHRIERGIYNPALTTGHRGLLPEAWGYPN